MTEPLPVLIARVGSHYQLTQAGEVLLRVPLRVFERFDASCVFPPLWVNADVHPVRRLYWNPDTLEFLMFGLDEQTVRFGETFGPSGYRSYLQGFWSPTPPAVFLRPYWRPEDPYDPFDDPARLVSLQVQRRFLAILDRLRPPEGWTAVLNAVSPYLDALGLNAEGRSGDPGDILELSLMPPAPLHDGRAAALFETLATAQAGHCSPVLRNGSLCSVHALGLSELHAAEAAVAAAGFYCREGPAFRH